MGKELIVVTTDMLWFDMRVEKNGIIYVGTRIKDGDLHKKPSLESVS